MAKIKIIKKGEEQIFPITIKEAVIDPTTNKTLVDDLALKADKSYVDTELEKKANETTSYSKTEVDNKLDTKVDKVTGKSLILDSEISRLSTVVNQTKTSLGLGNVNNTSDANKPVSTATAAAIADGLAGKSDTDHNHTLASLSEKKYSSLTGLPSLGSVASKNTGTASGQIPILGTGGKLDVNVIPKIAISETSVVTTEADMLALRAEIGDIAIRTDVSMTYILVKEDASLVENWRELSTPDGAVQSVAGKTGVVTLTKADVGLDNVDNTADSAKPISNLTQTALDLKAPLITPTFTGTPKAPTAAKATNTTQIATTAFVKAVVGDYSLSTHTHTPDQVGLGNVLNVKQATKAEFDTHITAYNAHVVNFTAHTDNKENPHGVTKAQIGLPDVENVAPDKMPVSDAQAASLALKANLTGATFTGAVTGTTFKGTSFEGKLIGNANSASQISTTNTNTSKEYSIPFVDGITNGNKSLYTNAAVANFSYNPSTNALTATTFIGKLTGNATSATSANNATTWNAQKYLGTSLTTAPTAMLGLESGNWRPTTATAAKLFLGLDKVNNTSDLSKPISTATQNALDLKANKSELVTFVNYNTTDYADIVVA